MNDFHYPQHIMNSPEVLLQHQGNFTNETINSLLVSVEETLATSGEKVSLKHSIINLLIEVLQNISKHGKSWNAEKQSHNSFLLAKGTTHYCIISRNPIRREDTKKLKKKLNQINSLDKVGLKTLYKERLKNAVFCNLNSGGLGLIDIARKSGSELKFSFSKINEEFSYFRLTIRMPFLN